MSCASILEYRKKYPYPIWSIFTSSTEIADPQTDGHITNLDNGYMAELEAIGQADAAIGTKALTAAPYPTRMRPVTPLSEILKSQNVMLYSVQFYAYDTTLEGSASQDAATLAAIYNSRATNDMYAQSFARNAFIQNWQPNFCRPSLKIDGKEIFRGFHSSNYGTKNNLGDMSIGIPLGYCFELYKELQKVHKIEMWGQIAQYIDDTSKYQRYCLYALLEWWIGGSSVAE